MANTGILEFEFPAEGDWQDQQTAQRALGRVDVWDLLSLDPRSNNATDVSFIRCRIRTLITFFDPDDTTIYRRCLQNRNLPDYHDFRAELLNLQSFLGTNLNFAERILLHLQAYAIGYPGRWLSTWNFNAIHEDALPGYTEPFQALPSFILDPIVMTYPSIGGVDSPQRYLRSEPHGTGLPYPTNENLSNLRALTGNDPSGSVAVAVVSQYPHSGQPAELALWIVFATYVHGNCFSDLQYRVSSHNIDGRYIGMWTRPMGSEASSINTITHNEIDRFGRWLGPFGRWGGHEYVARWFHGRFTAHGIDPDERDSLRNVVRDVMDDSDELET